MEGQMTWDTLFHKGADAFRRERGKIPKFLYAGTEAKALYSKSFDDAKDTALSYAGVMVVWVQRKVYFKFHL
jgi:hypothetical protein